MQTDTNDAYRNDPLFPPVPKGYHERMEQVLEALPVDEKHTVRVPKKRGIILLAAAVAALLAVGTAVAVSMSTREQLNEVVEQRIEQSDDERYQKARELAMSRVDADGYPHVIPLEGSADLGDVTPEHYNVAIPREEAISAMVKLLDPKTTEVRNDLSASDIPDYQSITEEYRDAIVLAYRYGVTGGRDAAHTFDPKASLTRAEISQLLLNVGLLD